MADAAFRSAAANPQPTTSFQTGDLVVYPSHGIGQVERVGPEEIAGHKLQVISVHFAEQRMTLRIPLANSRAGGLRPIATPQVVAEVIRILGTKPKISRTLWAKRAQESQARINSGDIKALAEVVRDLQAGPGDTGRSYSQRNLFELAIDRLGAEVAAVLKIDKQAAIDRLTGSLQPAAAADAKAPESETAEAS
jgi:CarD family transcriptional regulator